MTQPTPYRRGYDFSDAGGATPPGGPLDGELDDIGRTLRETLRNLAIIQRDDTGLRNGIVGIDALDARVLGLISGGTFSIAGQWLTATAYAAGAFFADDEAVYLTIEEHVSTSLVDDIASGVIVKVFQNERGSRVRDDFTGNGVQTGFTLSQSVTSQSDVEVYVNGVLLAPTEYTQAGSALTFDVAPAVDADISAFSIMWSTVPPFEVFIAAAESAVADAAAALAAANVMVNDLASSASNKGAKLVKYRSRWVRDRLDDEANLRDFGANADNDPAADCYAAAIEAMGEGYQVFRLPYVPGEANIAWFSQFPSTTTFVGMTFDIDPRITLSLPDKNSTGAQNSQGVRYTRTTTLYSRDLGTTYHVDPDGAEAWYGNGRKRLSPAVDPLLVEKARPYLVDPATLTPLKVAWPAGDAWTADAGAITIEGRDYIITAADADSLQGNFRPLKPGDEMLSSMNGTDPAIRLSAIVLHTKGYQAVTCLMDRSSIPRIVRKDVGGTQTDAAIGVLGPGTHGSYSGLGSVWSIRIDDWQHFSILLNGVAVASRHPVTGIITHAGFGMKASAGGQMQRTQEPMRVRGNKARAGIMEAIIVYGDSKSSLRYDSWTPYFKNKLDLSCGIRCWKLTNRAVGGDGVAGQLALITADETSGVLADHNTVVIPLGTNDAQAQTNIGTFYNDLATMVTKASGGARKVVLGIPSVWYGLAQSGGSGQNTQNYDAAAYYRMIVYRVAAEFGCSIIDPMNFEGPILGHFVNSGLEPDLTAAGDPVKDDNIHDTTISTRMFADELANIVAGFHVGPKNGLYMPMHVVEGVGSNGWKSGASEPLRATISQDGMVNLYGLIEVDGAPTRADGTVTYTVPAYLRPPGVKRISEPARSHNTDALLINFDTVGQLAIFGATNSTYFDLSGVSYCIEDREPLS